MRPVYFHGPEIEERIGESQPLRCENEPYLFRIKFVSDGNRTRDIALTRQQNWLKIIDQDDNKFILKGARL